MDGSRPPAPGSPSGSRPIPCNIGLLYPPLPFPPPILSLPGSPALRGLPVFLYGVSMGGAVAIKAHWMRPQGFQGAILNAPMVKVGGGNEEGMRGGEEKVILIRLALPFCGESVP